MMYMRPSRTVMVRHAPVGDVWDDIAVALGEKAIPADQATDDDAVTSLAFGPSTTADDFVTVGNVCKARNFPALAYAKELQDQLNRVAQIKQWPKTDVDGAIGPATVALFKRVQAAAAGAILGDASSCTGIAPDVDVLSVQVKQFADTLGAPATVSPPVTSAFKASTILTKSGKTVVAPDAGIAGALAQLSGAEKVALLGLAGGIAYVLVTKKKKRRK